MSVLGHELVGRDAELSFLQSFVAESFEGGGGALLVTGDAGVGKSAVLSAVAADQRRRGVQVLRASGSEFEAALSFGGLGQLLGPLLGQLDEVDEADRQTLRVALGLADGVVAVEQAVAIATLRLLATVASVGPLMVVIDDVNWLDRASSAVLAYVARRVEGTGIVLIAAMRTGERTPFGRGGLDTYELGPLSDAAAVELLQARFPRLALRTRSRLVTEAEGNPLALLELPIALSSRAPVAGPLPDVLPLTERLERLFAGRIDHLPSPTRDLLLLAVLDGTAELAVLDPEGGLDNLAPAERTHVAYLNDTTGRVVFQHPLVRSAIFQRSTSSERRLAHQLLAERLVDNPERRAWHLAQAATAPDEEVAAVLQQVAHDHLRRGDAVAAIDELLRSAQLSVSKQMKSSRLAEAAYVGASINGDLSQMPRLLEEARASDPESAGALAGAVAGAYYLLNSDGEIDLAHRLLVGAIESVPDSSDTNNKQLHEAIYNLLGVCFFAGRGELFAPLDTALARFVPRPPELLEVVVSTFGDPVRAGPATLSRLDRLVDQLSTEPSPDRTVKVARACAYVDRLGACRPALRRVVEEGRQGQGITAAIEALFLLGNDAYFSGRWDELGSLVEEGLNLCEEYGYQILSWPGIFLRALVAAARGDATIAEELSDDMTRWAKPRRAGAILTYASHVRALLALGQGEYDLAYRHATAIDPPGRLSAHAPQVLWVITDVVEAAIRSDRLADARFHVDALTRARVAEISPRLSLVVQAAAAMTAPDDGKRSLFTRVLDDPDVGQYPFEHARTLLAYGEYLRRAKATGEARVYLEQASEGFRVLGARPWVQKATLELRAAGTARASAPAQQLVSLTAQQLEIAQLAAQGLTNKQIGERLFLSARTVGTHLYQLYPKLGITSRAALRDALERVCRTPEAGVRRPAGRTSRGTEPSQLT